MAPLIGRRWTTGSLSYLPLSHIAEQHVHHPRPAVAGCPGLLRRVAREGPRQPQGGASPRSSSACRGSGRSSTPGSASSWPRRTGAKKALVEWAREVGKKVSTDLRNRGEEPGAVARVDPVQARRQAGALQAQSRRSASATPASCITGAAPIAPEVLEFFASLDLTILEVYGQSEDTGPTTFNLPGQGQVRHASARPIPGCRGEDRRGRRDPGAGPQRVPRLLQGAGGHRRDAASTAGCTPATSASSTRDGFLCDHRPQEGHHHHRRRQEHRPQEHRGGAQEPRAGLRRRW